MGEQVQSIALQGHVHDIMSERNENEHEHSDQGSGTEMGNRHNDAETNDKRPLLEDNVKQSNQNGGNRWGPRHSHAKRPSSNRPPTSRANLYLPPIKRRRLEQEKLKKKQTKQEEEEEEEEEGAASDPERDARIEKEKQEQFSEEKQQETWLAQTRKIHGCINRLSIANIKERIVDLLENVNLIRLRGCLAHSLLQAMTSTASQSYLSLYSGFLAVIHSKLPAVGQVTVHRLVAQFRLAYQRRDKARVTSMACSLSHLFVHAVVHELLILQLLTLLLSGGSSSKSGGATNDSLGVAIKVFEIVGVTLQQVSSAGYRAILDQMRSILASQRDLHPQLQQALQQLLQNRPDFQIDPRLDLVELEDQITLSELDLDQPDLDTSYDLDHFRHDPDFEQHEREWSAIQKELLGLDDSDDDSEGDGETEDDEEEEEEEEEEAQEANDSQSMPVGGGDNQGKATTVQIQDLTEADLVHLRRTIYLTIMSSATFEECAHKLASIDIPEGREEELVNMLMECCAQERTFLRYYGLIGARFCLLADRWKNAFMNAFGQQYNTIHRLETNKLRNVSKLFAHMLYTHAMPWSVFENIRMTEDATTSSSRIFCKILLQEMAEALGIPELKRQFGLDEEKSIEEHASSNNTASQQRGGRPQDVDRSVWFQGLFPMQGNLRETRYAINFLTSIGLGPLTDSMRAYLKNAPAIQAEMMKKAELEAQKEEDSDASSVLSSSSSSVSSSSSSSLSTSSSDSDSSSSSYDRRRRRRKQSSSSRRKSSSSRRRSRRSPSSSSDESSVDSRERRSSKNKSKKTRNDSEAEGDKGRSKASKKGDDRDGKRRSSDKERSKSPDSGSDAGGRRRYDSSEDEDKR